MVTILSFAYGALSLWELKATALPGSDRVLSVYEVLVLLHFLNWGSAQPDFSRKENRKYGD